MTKVVRMNQQLKSALKSLKLSGLLSSLEVRLQEAQGNQLSHLEFLELIVSDEIALRQDRAIERRVRAAGFREKKSIEDFDFSFNPSINRRQIMELATCRFIREQRDILFTGPPGVGKSHLAQGIGHQAAKMGYVVMYRSIFDTVGELNQAEALNENDKAMRRYLRPDLLIIDDMGLKKLPKQSWEYLFEIIMRRYEWGKLVGDVPTATAIIDRFLSRADIVQITGKSYRLKDAACKSKNENGKE